MGAIVLATAAGARRPPLGNIPKISSRWRLKAARITVIDAACLVLLRLGQYWHERYLAWSVSLRRRPPRESGASGDSATMWIEPAAVRWPSAKASRPAWVRATVQGMWSASNTGTPDLARAASIANPRGHAAAKGVIPRLGGHRPRPGASAALRRQPQDDVAVALARTAKSPQTCEDSRIVF
jgi:hypothetical protein